MRQILDLPNELLSTIFEYIDYSDLKGAIPLTCQCFHDLLTKRTQTGIIDRILFRDEPAKEFSSEYQIHPVFNLISTRLSKDPTSPELDPTRDYRRMIAVRYPVAAHRGTIIERNARLIECLREIEWFFTLFGKKFLNNSIIPGENAVSPACSNVWLRIENETDEDTRSITELKVQKWPRLEHGRDAILAGDVMQELYYRLAIIAFGHSVRALQDDRMVREQSGGVLEGEDLEDDPEYYVFIYHWEGITGVESRNGAVYLTSKIVFLGSVER